MQNLIKGFQVLRCKRVFGCNGVCTYTRERRMWSNWCLSQNASRFERITCRTDKVFNLPGHGIVQKPAGYGAAEIIFHWENLVGVVW